MNNSWVKENMSKRKFDEMTKKNTKKNTKKKLLIPVAKYGKVGGPLKDITPDRYKDMKEVQAAVKSGESCIRCSDGHDLIYRNESKNGRRRPHFAHKHDCHNDGCNYIRKYGGKGESPEHLQAKLRFGLQPRVVFCVECEQVCGNYIRTVEVPKEWTYKTEQRLTMTNGKYIWVDGAFIDESGVVQLVVEVKHTHGTTGDKLKWLQKHAFEFFEVEAKTVQESLDGRVTVINQKNDHRLCGECEKRISEAKRVDKERLEAQAKCEERQAVFLANYEKTPERQALKVFNKENRGAPPLVNINAAMMEQMRLEWERCPENQMLCKLFPDKVIPTGKAKKLHCAIALAFNPHLIYWMSGWNANQIKWGATHPILHEYAKRLKQIFEFPKKQPDSCFGNGWNHHYSPLKAYFTKVLLQKEIEEKTRVWESESEDESPDPNCHPSGGSGISYWSDGVWTDGKERNKKKNKRF